MITQNQDSALTKVPGQRQDYYAAVPAHMLDRENSVIDELISFAFDTLGGWHLHVRVYDETTTHETAGTCTVVL